MSNIRVIQQSIDVLGYIDTPNLRVSQQSIDVLGYVDQPAIRVSQQSVQVAGSVAGSARLSRAYLEVLSPLHSYSVVDSLSLTQEMSLGDIPLHASNILYLSDSVTVPIITADITDTITITDALAYSGTLRANGSATLSLSSSVVYHITARFSNTDTLTITDAASYIGPKWFSIVDTLVLTSTAREPDLYELTLSSTLTLTDVVTYHGRLNYSANNTLVFVQYADNRIKVRNTFDTLSLTDLAIGSRIIFAYSTLELTHELAKGITSIQVDDTLTLVQVATGHSSLKKPTLTQTLTLTSTVEVYPYYGRGSDSLELEDLLEVVFPVHYSATSELISVTYEVVDGELIPVYTGLSDSATFGINATRTFHDYLQWGQQVDHLLVKGTASSESVNTTLVLTDTARLSKTEDVTSTLSLSQSLTGLIATRSDTELEVDQTASITKTTLRSLDSELQLLSAFTYTKTGVSTCGYNPTFGTGTDLPKRLVNTPVLTKQDTIALWWPFESPTNTLTLRCPDFGNRNRVEFQRINRRSIGGTLLIWADQQWPKNENINITIKALTESQGQEALDFIYTSIGQEIGFTDWEGNTWKAVLMNPDTAISRLRTNNIQLDLQLELTWSAYSGLGTSTLNLTQVASGQKISTVSGENTFIPWDFGRTIPGIKARSGESALSVLDTLRRVIDVTPEDTLSLTSMAVAVQQLEDTLSITQVAWPSLPQVSGSSSLSITDSCEPGLRYLALADTLALAHSRSYVIE